MCRGVRSACVHSGKGGTYVCECLQDGSELRCLVLVQQVEECVCTELHDAALDALLVQGQQLSLTLVKLVQVSLGGCKTRGASEDKGCSVMLVSPTSTYLLQSNPGVCLIHGDCKLVLNVLYLPTRHESKPKYPPT